MGERLKMVAFSCRKRVCWLDAASKFVHFLINSSVPEQCPACQLLMAERYGLARKMLII